VIDWHRLNLSSPEECDAILRANEFHPEDPDYAARLNEICDKTIACPQRNFEWFMIIRR